MVIIMAVLILSGCQSHDFNNVQSFGRQPVTEPDYAGVTIPYNIAPMNFLLQEDGNSYYIRAISSVGTQIFFKSHDGIVRFPLKSWKNLLKESKGGRIKIIVFSDNNGNIKRFDTIYMKVASETIDPFLCYRLLYPGYKSWLEMKIVQRSTENFTEESVIENQLLQDNCVNCHSFNRNDPQKFMLHVRGSLGGTYFVDGDKIKRIALKTPQMPANVVYPSWHPSGKYVAFSSNKTVQTFHMQSEKNIEVFDLFSSLVIYDVDRNEIFDCPESDTVKYMETFPCWSPEGDYLYYCRTPEIAGKNQNYREARYNLVRKSFDREKRIFGKAELLFDASNMNKSVSFPAISPNGKFLVFTLHDYGTFSIWHKEADLYLLNLNDGRVGRMTLNSDETESYHSWSSNGKWLVFSSKRDDGLTARPYFAYVDTLGNTGKPFVLPQKDPTLYKRLSKTYNRPELITGKIMVGTRDFARASKKEPLQAR